ncbi:hypothetical protein [Candidatus Poriferisodalis sp.]|uniref:hypothetical protein n=1 Tax=Candidatus Poriferisodalis sp. TaxID=3101277 RepID=UPI003B0217B1
MSQHLRTRVYAWLREQTDEPTAEYLMACLMPAPLPDLVTKEHLSAELSRFATKDDLANGLEALRAEQAAQRAEDRAEHARQRAEDRAEHARQRAEDLRAARQRHYWLTGTIITVTLPSVLSTFGIVS